MQKTSLPPSLRLSDIEKMTLAVFESVPYSFTHYSLYSVYDIVNYIGNEQTRIQTLC